jgi:hypothetical protein
MYASPAVRLIDDRPVCGHRRWKEIVVGAKPE